MKVKGISFFELHAEKFVLGAAVLILLGVLYLQFAGGDGVRVDGREVSVGEVNSILRQRAEGLASRLRSDSPAGVDLLDGDLPMVAEAFGPAVESGIANASPLPRSMPSLAGMLIPSDIADVAWYHEPRLASAPVIDVVQTSDALTEEGWARLQALGGRFEGDPTTYDVTWLTPAASIDLASLRRALAGSKPASDPPRMQIPSVWFNDALQIVDVVFERQELVDGAWGAIEMVPAFPTQDSFRPYIAEADADLRDDVFDELQRPARQLEILQPEFVPTANGLFVPPVPTEIASAAEDPAMAAAGEEVRRLQRELQRYRQDRARTQARLDELGGPVRDDEMDEGDRSRGRGGRGDRDDAGGGGSSPPGGRGLGSGGMQGRRGSGEDAAAIEARNRKRRALTDRVNRLDGRIAATEEALRDLAPDMDTGADDSKLPDVNADDRILVWTHDLDVVANRTYRYRVRVEIYNPFFARTNQLVPEQQPLADGFTMATAVGPWSEGVMVSPPVSFFLMRANPGDGGLGLGTASVEIFAFRDGRRRSQTFSVQPGDVIGEVANVRVAGRNEGDVDFSTGWYVIDILADPSRDGGDASDGGGAIVLVGRLDDSNAFERRVPDEDRSSSDRRRFIDEVRASDSAAREG